VDTDRQRREVEERLARVLSDFDFDVRDKYGSPKFWLELGKVNAPIHYRREPGRRSSLYYVVLVPKRMVDEVTVAARESGFWASREPDDYLSQRRGDLNGEHPEKGVRRLYLRDDLFATTEDKIRHWLGWAVLVVLAVAFAGLFGLFSGGGGDGDPVPGGCLANPGDPDC
jgi:hypothetical protein